jgi:hypothetical protein
MVLILVKELSTHAFGFLLFFDLDGAIIGGIELSLLNLKIHVHNEQMNIMQICQYIFYFNVILGVAYCVIHEFI